MSPAGVIPGSFPLTYEDCYGVVETTCWTDGHGLVFSLRGRTFRGCSFSLLDPDGTTMAELPDDLFPVGTYGVSGDGDLLAKFTLTVPLAVTGAGQSAGNLTLTFDLRDLRETKDYDYVDGCLELDGATYRSTRGYVENLLIDVQEQLPDDVFLVCCLSCRWSHYTPCGNDDFGCLRCLRDWDDASTVSSKGDLFRAWSSDAWVQVQETWCCPRFSLLQPGQWAYKDWGQVYQKAGRVPPPEL
ncbi:MAG: DUF6304 family protein [Micrococcales bacterium]|nr:DUF6304 family protein [Micrococcales bacterium]